MAARSEALEVLSLEVKTARRNTLGAGTRSDPAVGSELAKLKAEVANKSAALEETTRQLEQRNTEREKMREILEALKIKSEEVRDCPSFVSVSSHRPMLFTFRYNRMALFGAAK